MKYDIMTISGLKTQINKNLYCFGAGRVFDSFMREFGKYRLEDDIKAIADNNADRMADHSKTVNGKNIPIITLEQMLRDIRNDDRILITTAAYEEVIGQLEKIEKLDSVKYYIASIMRIEQYDFDRINVKVPSRLSIYDEIKIPKTIHYCWFGGGRMPEEQRAWIEGWKKHCPDYQVIEWNENNYDIKKSRYTTEAYSVGQWVFVADYVRLDVVGEYGGVYLDTDVELLRNIDGLLMNDAFCGFAHPGSVAFGLGFGAVRNHSVIREIKNIYDEASFILPDGSLDKTTGPQNEMAVLKRHGLKANGEFQVTDGVTVFPPMILDGMSQFSFRTLKNLEHTYAIHHYAGSWDKESGRTKASAISLMKKWGMNDIYVYHNI